MENQRYLLEKTWLIVLKDLGISEQDVLRHARLPLDLFSRKSPTISADDYFRLWHGLAHVMRDPTYISANAWAGDYCRIVQPANICLFLQRKSQCRGQKTCTLQTSDRSTTSGCYANQPTNNGCMQGSAPKRIDTTSIDCQRTCVVGKYCTACHP